jgi:hypothetical protein
MPYILPKHRKELQRRKPASAGELNYHITVAVKDYLESKNISYSTLNEVVGVLECVKQELYRRVVSPYEDLKRNTNGDVYNQDTK